MKLISLETGNFKVDGGAMFGVVPKILWSKLYPSDEKNLCPCAIRSLLILDGDKKILIDTGIGNKLEPEFAKHYYMFGEENLINSLKENDISPEEITDIVLTHLHFDHCGGTTDKNDKNEIYPVFKNAKLWISKDQMGEAMNPNLREKPAFLDENIKHLNELYKVNLIEKNTEINKNIEIRLFNGHTKGLISVFINYKGKKVVFAGDVIPALPYLRLPYVSAYDVFPLQSIEDKKQMLKDVYDKDGIIFFQHDIYTEACSLKETRKGYREDKLLKIEEID